jgi:hypothetical protein
MVTSIKSDSRAVIIAWLFSAWWQWLPDYLESMEHQISKIEKTCDFVLQSYSKGVICEPDRHPTDNSPPRSGENFGLS